ncbi:hypothetical protein CRG98_018482 [Punica granatum]|uniref:Uncharacterized protein n=1 Tax=Punica granatum TaxID=22663 RepID=A0A2I0JY30_PUNGR|nr:hypothetical protein CRG98_018482 [Punica granatum]
MVFFFSPSLLASSAISLTVLSTLFFFFFLFIFPPTPSCPIAPPRGGLFNSPKSCSSNSLLSIPSLSLFLFYSYFYVLIKTAQDHFSIVTTKLGLQQK